jgi:hypothetical protein
MATGDNAILPLFTPADDVTCAASAAIGAGKFVKISADMQASPILAVGTPLVKGNLMVVAQCVAGDKAFGVSKWDASGADEVLGVFSGGQVVPMTAGGSITAGNKVMSDASGNPVAWTSAASEANNANGIAVSTATNGNTVYVKLFG